MGVKRGPYKRNINPETRRRVIAAADNEEDWKAVALNNGIPYSTAYGWVKSKRSPKKRGGQKKSKLRIEHVSYMTQLVGETPTLTLKEIQSKVKADKNVKVSTTTVHNTLQGKLLTLKKINPEPFKMNDIVNKQKRKDYVEKLNTLEAQGKCIIYIDETNVNLFLRRNYGRSFKGTRCSTIVPTSKGKNIHIIGAISKEGLVYHERRRGCYLKETCFTWVRNMLRRVAEPMENIVVVCDNAPVHNGLESVFEEDEYEGAWLLRAAPYSAPLNPIEECWSVLKAAMKREIAATMEDMLTSTHPGVSQAEHRMTYLETIIDNNIGVITPSLCSRTFEHVKVHYGKVIMLHDLKPDDK